MDEEELRKIEMKLLLEGVFQVYGYDFRSYSEASIRRRLTHWLAESDFPGFAEATKEVLRVHSSFQTLLRSLTVNVSEMFRDPAFFKALREQVIPYLKTFPFVKIWHAGCSRGEEAYSMAILLDEEGLQDRFRIYATDINPEVIEQARAGIYPIKDLQLYTRNYQKAGGRASFADYYTARYDNALLRPSLQKAILFGTHNLATDADLGEMHLVLCRNVLIYFKEPLKERALGLFDASLDPGGFLCLGIKETLSGHLVASHFEEVAPRLRIYRKRYLA
jgi:chemotaxis protein methyltransferase CheR